MVKGFVQPVPTSAATQYKLLLVQVLLVYSSPDFFAIDQHYFSFTDSFELQQTGHHKTTMPYISEVQISTMKTCSLQILQNIGGLKGEICGPANI